MRIIRDTVCDRCGAAQETMIDSKVPLSASHGKHPGCGGTFHGVLSPVTTTFKFADRSGVKRPRT